MRPSSQVPLESLIQIIWHCFDARLKCSPAPSIKFLICLARLAAVL